MLECKESIIELLNKIGEHLINFSIEGHKWLLNMLGNAKDEYLNLVNIKCRNATHLYEALNTHVNAIKAGYNNPKIFKQLVLDLVTYLDEVDSLIKTSINIVPYSKIDEFNILVYNARHDLSNEILSRYYNIAKPL